MGVDTFTFVMITLLAGGGTLAIRAVFILMARKQELPRWLMRLLAFVPAAVFAALITHTVHLERIRGVSDPIMLNLAALALAAFVAVRTRSIMWTLASGMSAMWLLQWAGSSLFH